MYTLYSAYYIAQSYLLYMHTYILDKHVGRPHLCTYGPQPPAVLPTDIDECNGTNPCAPNGNCFNTNGSFTCNCSSGYELDIDGQSCSGKCIPDTLFATLCQKSKSVLCPVLPNQTYTPSPGIHTSQYLSPPHVQRKNPKHVKRTSQ